MKKTHECDDHFSECLTCIVEHEEEVLANELRTHNFEKQIFEELYGERKDNGKKLPFLRWLSKKLKRNPRAM